MAFDDVRFPDDISYGSSGSPTYLTDIVILENAAENRAGIWSVALYSFDVSYGVKTLDQLRAVHDFFHGRRGRLRSFRFKDFTDFQATQTPLVLTGGKTIQLSKRYSPSLNPYDRPIRKPVSGFTMRRAGVSFVGFTPDNNTGIVTITTPDATDAIASAAGSITGITQAAQAVVTVVGHPFVTGDLVTITGVVGMTEVNGVTFLITNLSVDTFRLNLIDSTAFGAYVSGGTATLPGITQAAVAQVRAPSHGLSNGNVVRFTGVVGMTEINGLELAITVLSADRFTVPLNTTAFTTYIQSGTPLVELYPQVGGDAFDWTGEFDVPVRFDSDSLPATHQAFDIGNISSIPLIEVLRD